MVSPFGCVLSFTVALVDESEIAGKANITFATNKNQRDC